MNTIIILITVLIVILCIIKKREHFYETSHYYLLHPYIANLAYYEGTNKYASNPHYLGYRNYFKDSFDLGLW